jgi:hypothetical protein
MYLELEVNVPQIHASYPRDATQDTATVLPIYPTGLSPCIVRRSRRFRIIGMGSDDAVLKLHISIPFLARIQFALCRFHSLLLTASLLVSFPAGTETFQFPAFPCPDGHRREVSFGNPGFKGHMRLAQA